MTDEHDESGGWIDVSMPIHEGMVNWPGDPAARLPKLRELERGDHATLTHLDMSAHTGTHVDAPCHFVAGGAGVDEIDLSSLIGPARVVHVPDEAVVSAATIEGLCVSPGERLLFKTRNAERQKQSGEFDHEFTYLSLGAARALIAAGVRTVAIDYLSIGGGETNEEVHREMLGAGICVIEGVDLSAAPPGDCDFICLPLRIRGGDGAPARAVIRPR